MAVRTSFTLLPSLGERASGTYWLVDILGPRADVDVVEKRGINPAPARIGQ
jgi:hypothetical protein